MGDLNNGVYYPGLQFGPLKFPTMRTLRFYLTTKSSIVGTGTRVRSSMHFEKQRMSSLIRQLNLRMTRGSHSQRPPAIAIKLPQFFSSGLLASF
jgi:hypothetical protein